MLEWVKLFVSVKLCELEKRDDLVNSFDWIKSEDFENCKESEKTEE